LGKSRVQERKPNRRKECRTRENTTQKCRGGLTQNPAHGGTFLENAQIDARSPAGNAEENLASRPCALLRGIRLRHSTGTWRGSAQWCGTTCTTPAWRTSLLPPTARKGILLRLKGRTSE